MTKTDSTGKTLGLRMKQTVRVALDHALGRNFKSMAMVFISTMQICSRCYESLKMLKPEAVYYKNL
jgi:hypothetical protein